MRAARQLRPPSWRRLSFLAPVRGLNTVAPASQLGDLECPVLWNMIGAEDGLRARTGSVEFATGITGGADNTVRSIMPYTGGMQNGSKDRLFCATQRGIYDATAGGDITPGSAKIVFGTQTGDAGYGTWWITTTPADRYLIFCDEVNGYHLYTESTDTWQQVATGAGAGKINAPGDASKYVAGTFFAQRNWFVRKDSTIADVLPIQQVFGAPAAGPPDGTQFDFGNKFKAGGILTGLYNWSYDGGQGMQTMLVAVSSGGDIVIYAGINPLDASNFYLRGVWQTSGVPYGRRIATDFGGDTLVLTASGILPLSKLVIGNPVVDRSVYSTYNVANLFSYLVDLFGGLKAWSLRFHPTDSALLVTVPQNDGAPTTQLAMSLTTRGWSRYRNLSMISGEPWRRKFYVGTHDGRILVSTGYVDEVKLSDPTGATFTPVQWSLVTRADKGAMQRIVRQIRPTLLSGQNPLVNAEARFNFDISEAGPPVGLPGGASAAVFDSARFDVDRFAGDFATTKPVFGAMGRAPEVAVAVRGSAFSRTVLTDIDVMYDEGGFF